MSGGQGSYATDAHSHAHAHVHELVSVIAAALTMSTSRMLRFQGTEARIQNLLTSL